MAFFFCSFSFHLAATLDLEQMEQDFVLESRQINIPGYPKAYNPSIIRWDGFFLMSFRILTDPLDLTISKIGLVWLDKDFSPISEPQLLDIRGKNKKIPSRSEDARLFNVGKRVYVTYNDNEQLSRDAPRRIYLAELNYDGFNFSAVDIQQLSFSPNKDNRSEKNWVPFEYNDTPLIAYSIFPHHIISPLSLKNGECSSIAFTQGLSQWEWGEIRGGTPALLDGTEYLAFFHSWKIIGTVQSNNRPIYHYFMGAYTFAAQPPFRVTRMSTQPVIGKGFYNDTDIYTKIHKHVIFPSGFILDDPYVWVVYGRQDEQMWIAKIDKNKLLNSLISVPPNE